MILPTNTRWLSDGIQRIYKFDNGWEASVIMRYDQEDDYASDGGKEGLWEIAPMEMGHILNWEYAFEIGLYDTKGFLNDEELQVELRKLKEFHKASLSKILSLCKIYFLSFFDGRLRAKKASQK